MANEYFTASGNPATRATATSASMRAEFAAIVAGFDKLPTMTGNGGKLLVVNSAGTALTASSTIYEVSGKIGIATATPGTALGFVNGAQISWGASNYAYVSGSNATNVLTLGTQATERMRIDASGNVGLGTTTPGAKLDIVGTTARLNNSAAATDTAFNVTNSVAVTTMGTDGTGPYLAASGSNSLRLLTNAAERMRIDASGNVGVGGTSPASKLDVIASAADAILSLTVTGTQRWQLRTLSATQSFSVYDQTALAERLRIDVSGNVLSTGGGGLGYGTGSGGTVTQTTSKITAVTLNKPSGRITMNNAALAAGASVQFYLNNSAIGASDVIVVNPYNNVNYTVQCIAIAAGSAYLRVTNISGGSLSEALELNFAIIKGATA